MQMMYKFNTELDNKFLLSYWLFKIFHSFKNFYLVSVKITLMTKMKKKKNSHYFEALNKNSVDMHQLTFNLFWFFYNVR